MTRDRWLRPRWLIWLIVAWSVALASAPRLGDAAPLPPGRAGGAAGDLDDVRALLEHRLVRAQLADLGVSAPEAAELWQRLTPAEREELVGGDPVAAGVAIAIIVAMAVILVLELIGRRIISRPSTGAQP